MLHVPKERRSKWDVKAKKAIFVGYADDQMGFRCYDPSKGKVIITRDAVFLEPQQVKIGSKMRIDVDDEETSTDIRDKSFFEAVGDETASANKSARVEKEKDAGQSRRASNKDLRGNLKKASTSIVSKAEDKIGDSSPIDIQQRETLNISFGDFETSIDEEFGNFEVSSGEEYGDSSAEPFNNGDSIGLRRSERVRVPPERFTSYLACDREAGDPASIEEAQKSHNARQWDAAMKEELESLRRNETWELVELPPNRKPIKTKWVFKTKRDDNGDVVRHKARLVAKGCAQRYGVDYTETFSPVVRYTSIRLLIALAAQRGLRIDQMDAITAYLQGDLDESIYTQQPDGFDDGTGRVCHLRKAMYGLKQSGRQWNKCLDAALRSFDLIKSKSDPCVYFTKDVKLIVAIYVDDLLIFWETESIRDALKKQLTERFYMKDMGMAKTCVGLNIEYEDDGISINQSTYTREIIERFGMNDCRPAVTPVDTSQTLCQLTENEETLTNVPYQEAVGSLLYLVQGSRPDLAFAVSNVSRYNAVHGTAHWTAVKRIIRYLRGTAEYRIKYLFMNDALNGFVDADWGADVDQRRSCTGWIFRMAGAAVSWGCKKQRTVALSTAEAEYMAMTSAAQEATWLAQFLQQFEIFGPVVLYCDNKGAMDIAKEDAFRQNTKHIAIRVHYIRDQVSNRIAICAHRSKCRRCSNQRCHRTKNEVLQR